MNLRRRIRSKYRFGTTLVETAIVLPVLFMFLWAIIEFSHAQLINNMLNSACRTGARMGSVEGTNSTQVLARIDQVMGSVVDPEKVTAFVNDASVYDSGSTPPTSGSGIEALPDLELSDAEPRQMFVVRARLSYNDIAIVPMPFLSGVTLSGQAFMRHE